MTQETPRPEPDAGDPASAEGLPKTSRAFDVPALEAIERRRRELLAVTAVLVVGFAGGMVLLTFVQDLPGWLTPLGESLNFLRAAVVCLAVAFVTYVFNHERALREVTQQLVNERVLAAALSNKLREISSLSKAGRVVVPSARLDTVVDQILGAAFDLMEADGGSLFLVRGDQFEVAAGVGTSAQFKGSKQALYDGVAGYVARTREPLVIHGAAQRAEFTGLIEREESVVSSISVPLRVGSEVIGVLSLNVSTGGRRYTEYDARALGMFGEHAASVIETAQVLDAHPAVRSAIAVLERARAGEAIDRSEGSLEAAAVPAKTPGRVLVAEDDPAMLRLLQTSLETSGYHVLLASDGETALRRIQEERPRVVVLDLVLPVMDGWGVLERLQDRGVRPRVICLTAKSSSRDTYKAWNLGADEYVVKPFELDALLRMVNEVSDRSEDERHERRQRALQELLGRS